ncbi:hypothetical protein C8R44DRAFT_585696, partial [Mycena epipterygia]
LTQLTLVVKNSLVIAAVLIGNVVIIHRLWVIWNRDLRIVFVPVLSWLGILTCGIAIIYVFTQFIATNNKISTADGAWVTANWALNTLCATNLIPNSAFIAWRIWKTSRAEAEVGGGLLMPVLGILIESAIIWTTWEILFGATFWTGSTLQLILSDLTLSIVGLVNLLIHLRVVLGWSHAEASESDATSAP